MSNDFHDLHKALNYIRGIGKVVDESWQHSAQEIGITQSEQHILWILFFEKKASMSRIAEVGLWDLSTVMQIVKRLKAKELVRTTKDEQDLRVSYVCLTDKGEQKREESAKFESPFMNYIKAYMAQSEENKQFVLQMGEFIKEANSFFHGKEFVKWVEKTGQK
ncbi:MarR family winged helix-turn-helix transcriptional regulator [Bacillus sp. FJAT-45350]|uniref:MarR family winged helix-turn-helix transcriptional regulator n=1 Tax=Bacillus sp. FJAT-45350 TaxID=2011014 RepID=UPI0015CBB0B9|nr:MarR family transcriptional regulator [Bacillus sp. FJAT-45350]